MSVVARSPLSSVFLLHIALEAPLALQAFWSPQSLPFMQMNNTTVLMLKLYGALIAGSCVTAFLAYPLPEFLPGKRALAIGFCIYHSVVSTILFQAPRFIPHSLGPFFESINVTPEVVWGTFHGVLGLAMIVWWQVTLQYAAAVRGAAQ
ncbi:hypothetical protein K503DRAFT_847801 [Rhizopogon vinicolor AM-OR11-026]|uniref:Uncharacterized protein n=1 Tax=Rhizopogon vinicolor AM-OR11-026 TaxID=1314800 RepID=A0A1B7NC47_9AGAM|nr:hypothetical protein K503DRAFT_847801 [Rhizopogon vinicolor AM-OR11-026]